MDTDRVAVRRTFVRPLLIGAGVAFAWLGASIVLGLGSSHAHADTRDPDLLDGLTATVSQVADAVVKPVVAAVQPVTTPVATVTTTVAHVAAPVVAIVKPVTATVAPVVEPVAHAVAPVTAAVAPVIAPVTDVVAPVTETITPITAPVVGLLTPVVAPLAPVLDPLQPVLAPVGRILAPVVTPLQPVIGPVVGVPSSGDTGTAIPSTAPQPASIAGRAVGAAASVAGALIERAASVISVGYVTGPDSRMPLAPPSSPYAPLSGAEAGSTAGSTSSGLGLGIVALAVAGFAFNKPLLALARCRAGDRLPVSNTFDTDSSPD